MQQTTVASRGCSPLSFALLILAPALSSAQLAAVTDRADDILHWSDVALTNSGTATLHVAAHECPMLVMYNVSRWSWYLLGRWLLKTRTFALPNIIVQRDHPSHIVPELVPHFGQVGPVVEGLKKLVNDSAAREAQRDALRRLGERFSDLPFGDTAARRLFAVLEA